jgi:hypothetical protein
MNQSINPDLIPLAKGWWWHVYNGGIGPKSTRWIVHNGPNEFVFVYRCLTCGYETWHNTGLGAHNQGHNREGKPRDAKVA